MEAQGLRKLFYSYIISLLIIVVSCRIMVSYGDDFMMLSMSILWMIMAILVYVIIKSRWATLIYTVFNAFVAGMAMAVYYLKYDNFEMIGITTILIILVSVCLNYILYTVTSKSETLSKWMTFMWVVIAVLGAYQWGIENSIQGSWIVFLSITGIAINIAILFWSSEEREFDVFKTIRFFAMLLLSGILFIVLAIITEGDTLEFLDGFAYNNNKKA